MHFFGSNHWLFFFPFYLWSIALVNQVVFPSFLLQRNSDFRMAGLNKEKCCAIRLGSECTQRKNTGGLKDGKELIQINQAGNQLSSSRIFMFSSFLKTMYCHHCHILDSLQQRTTPIYNNEKLLSVSRSLFITVSLCLSSLKNFCFFTISLCFQALFLLLGFAN